MENFGAVIAPLNHLLSGSDMAGGELYTLYTILPRHNPYNTLYAGNVREGNRKAAVAAKRQERKKKVPKLEDECSSAARALGPKYRIAPYILPRLYTGRVYIYSTRPYSFLLTDISPVIKSLAIFIESL